MVSSSVLDDCSLRFIEDARIIRDMTPFGVLAVVELIDWTGRALVRKRRFRRVMKAICIVQWNSCVDIKGGSRPCQNLSR